jgi:hypothetical protein
MEAAGRFETSVPRWQAIQHHFQKDCYVSQFKQRKIKEN